MGRECNKCGGRSVKVVFYVDFVDYRVQWEKWCSCVVFIAPLEPSDISRSSSGELPDSSPSDGKAPRD